MDMACAVRIVVPDGRPAAALQRIEPGIGEPREIVEQLVDLPRRRIVPRRPGDHPVAISLLFAGEQRVGEQRDLGRIAAQDRDAGPRFLRVIELAEQVARERSRALILSVLGEFDVH